jgi:hypothetical protein
VIVSALRTIHSEWPGTSPRRLEHQRGIVLSNGAIVKPQPAPDTDGGEQRGFGDTGTESRHVWGGGIGIMAPGGGCTYGEGYKLF